MPDERKAGDDSGETPQQAVANWLAAHGDAVYAYAVRRVESRDVADELVQETFLAALKHFARFSGRASPKTWLIAILRNKIIEHYRRRSRHKAQAIDETGDVNAMFDKRGIWAVQVSNWPQTDDALENEEFWQAFDDCVNKLPGPTAEVFLLRVIDGLATELICKTLKISSSNMSVRLHRARLQLRECLERNWMFSDEK